MAGETENVFKILVGECIVRHVGLTDNLTN